MPTLRSVTVAILSWNGREHLETCLAALAAQRDPGVPWTVMVLDNGSSDDTAAWMARAHPEIALLRSPVNLGFCGGIEHLVARCDSDAVALLNNDTRPREDWLAALVDALSAAPDDVAAVSGLIVDWSGRRLDFGRGVMTFDGHAFQHGYGTPLDEAALPRDAEELLFACGGNMLIRRRSFLEAGGFDLDYFAYLEDVDLGWRLWSGGERILAAPQAVIHHRSMATSDLLGNDHRGFLFERNAFLTAYKNYQDGWWQRIMPAVWLTWNHRAQTLLVQNNLRGELLTLDPYAGHIANTATKSPTEDPSASDVEAPLVADPAPGPRGLRGRWRAYGGAELARRGVRKALRSVLPAWALDPTPGASDAPVLHDGRTVAQLRSMTYLLGHLDDAAAKRAVVQARRRRDDREIFERFPLAVVATYPGDERLFDSPAFGTWLPDDLPVVRQHLDEIMAPRDADP